MPSLPDNYDLWVQHEAECERRLAKRPVCGCCEEPIGDEYAFFVYGEWYHEECFKSEYWREVPEE